jgi:hypothetical protein
VQSHGGTGLGNYDPEGCMLEKVEALKAHELRLREDMRLEEEVPPPPPPDG